MTGTAQVRSRVEAALDLRRYREAASEAEQLLATAGPSAEGFALLARAQLGLAEYGKAEETAARGLSSNPASSQLLRIRAVAQKSQGRAAEALRTMEEATRLGPGDPMNHFYRAICLEAVERFGEALAASKRAAELDPADAGILLQLGSLELRTDPAVAEQKFRDALRIDPNSSVALGHLGLALLRQKRIDDARTAFRSALMLDPSSLLAKRGLHASVKNTLAKVGGAGIAGIAAIRALGLGSRFVGPEARLDPMLVGIALLAVVSGLVIIPRWSRAHNRAALAERDPQLLEIYQRLEADKKAGRL